MLTQSHDEIRRAAGRAIGCAREYFCINPLWKLTLDIEPIGEFGIGRIDYRPEYRTAILTLNPSNLKSFEHMWGIIGHEVGHLVFAEQTLVKDLLKAAEKWEDEYEPIWCFANERAVSVLQAMFVRDRPYPGEEDL
jgi:hypothetical protein